MIGFAIAVKLSVKAEEKWYSDNECKYQSTRLTGEQRYCGKACWTDEKESLYQCKFGEHRVLH